MLGPRIMPIPAESAVRPRPGPECPKNIIQRMLATVFCPFTILGISKNGASKKEVLKAWRRKMKVFHSDKTGDGDDTAAKVLNDAKERALKDVTDKSLGLGDKAQQEFEAASGIQVDEDRMELLHRILTGQTELRDGSTQAEQSDVAERWMDKDAFKKDIFSIMSYGLGRY